jgi:hypothetical protein
MAHALAVVNQHSIKAHEIAVGSLMRWTDYRAFNPLLDKYLEEGDNLFLVGAANTSRGERLWLIAVYEEVSRTKDGWFAARKNRVPVIDITKLRKRLKFHTGNGLSQAKGKLGNTLQTPRLLTENDLLLLEQAIAGAGAKISAGKSASIVTEAEEGERVKHEASRFVRAPHLALERLRKDNYRCRHCGFSVEKLTNAPKSLSRVLHVHHIRPLSDTGNGTTKLSDLITLCPTCHAVAHAIARAKGKDLVNLKLLQKYFPNP